MKRILFFLIFVCLKGFSQPNPIYQQPQIFPSSPEASAMFKVSDVPLDYSTGTANINIPFYTIEQGGIKIPISLTYNTGGIKLQEVAGLTGLGWNLNAGGVINVKQEVIEPGLDVLNSAFKQASDITTGNSYAAVTFASQVNNGLHEKETPEYYYRFGEYSGSFFYDIYNQVHIKSDNENLSINRFGSGFRITTDKGLVYTFNDWETTSGQSGWTAISGLFVSTVYNPNTNTTITFRYKGAGYSNSHEVQSLVYLTQPLGSHCCPAALNASTFASFYPSSVGDLQIDSIIFPSGYIKFSAANDRQDIHSTRITGMKVYSNANNAVVKSIQLYQSYFVSSSGSSDTRYRNRMKLDSVAIQDNLSNNIERFGFFYNMAYAPPYKLSTNHDNPGVDYYGYYNGHDGQGGLIPSALIPAYDLANYAIPNTFFGDRHPDSNCNQAFVLQRIIYPTGGVVKLDYETNKVPGYFYGDLVGGLRLRYISYYDHYNDLFPAKQKYFHYILGTLPIPATSNDYAYSKVKSSDCWTPDCVPNPDLNCYGSRIDYYTVNMGSDPLGMKAYFSATPFYYQVEEYDVKSGLPFQKSIYYYDSVEQYYRMPLPVCPEYGSNYFTQRNWLNSSLLLKTEIYKTDSLNNFRLVKKEANTYTDYNVTYPQVGLLVTSRNNFDFMGYDLRDYKACATDQEVLAGYNFFNLLNSSGIRRLTQKDVVDYSDNNDSLKTSFSYVYNAYFYLQSLVVTNSKGETLSTTCKYPFDKSYLSLTPNASVAVDTMWERNMLGYVLNQVNYRGSNLYKYQKVNYRVWSQPGGPIVQPETIEEGSFNSPSEVRQQIYAYDNNGNILERSKTSDVHETILWGYKNQYPVARIVGSTYASASSFVNQATLQNPSSDQQLRDEVNKIRTGLASTKAMVTTYSFSPLVGVTSETDQAGKTSYYAYDNFNRLDFVKDLNGNVIKTFDYNYTPRPSSYGIVYFNSPIASVNWRTNCTPGYLAGSWTYAIPAGKYSSLINQLDADNQAANDAITNEQTVTNTKATCTPPPSITFTYTNLTSRTYVLQMKNNATNVSTNLVMPPTTGMTQAVAGTVPAGIYTVYLFSPQGGTVANLVLGDMMQQGVYSLSSGFYNLNSLNASAYIY